MKEVYSKGGRTKKRENNNTDKNKTEKLDIWSLYLYVMKFPATRQKYIGRLDKFLKFLGLEGTNTEEKSKSFFIKSKNEGTQWVFNNILRSICISHSNTYFFLL